MININYLFYRWKIISPVISILTGIALLLVSLLVFFLPEDDQPMITASLVCLSIIFTLLICIPLARSRFDGKIDWFHPSILFMVVYFAYFMFPGVWLWLTNNYEGNWVDFGNRPATVVNTVFTWGWISIYSFALGMRIRPFSFRKSIRRPSKISAQINWKRMHILIVIFLLIGGLFKFYRISLIGPLTTDILRYLSPTARGGLGINISQFFIMLDSMLDWAALLLIFRYIVKYKETGKKNTWWIIVSVMIIVALSGYIVSGKRSVVIPLLLLPLIWHHYIIKRFSVMQVSKYFIAGMALSAVLLVGRIILPMLTNNLSPADYIGANLNEILSFYFNSAEWASFDLIAASVLLRDTLLEQVGGPVFGFLKYSFSTLIIFIPRALWPDKPGYEDLSHVYYRVLIGSNTAVGFTPTIWGSFLLFSNVSGLIIVMCVLGWLFNSLYRKFQLQKGRPIAAFYYSIFFWMTFQYIRFGTTGFVLVMFIQSMVMGVIAGLLIQRKQ